MASLASREGRELQRYIKGCRQVVGCIPYRYKNSNQLPPVGGTLIEDIEVLLVSSQKSERMMFPKGGWEIDESIEEAALRETREEAGVVGVVQSKLGKWSFQSKSQHKLHEGHMFPLLVEEELYDFWPEKDIRRRRWMGVGEARAKCEASWMKEALEVFVGRLKRWRLEEEENRRRASLLGYLRTEEIVSQNGEEKEVEEVEEEEEEEEEGEEVDGGYQHQGENMQSICSAFSNSQFSKDCLRSCLEMQMLMVQD